LVGVDAVREETTTGGQQMSFEDQQATDQAPEAVAADEQPEAAPESEEQGTEEGGTNED
jgi:hypothetical protein